MRFCRGLFPGLLSNLGEKSINLYFIRVPLRKKVLKYATPKPSSGALKHRTLVSQGFRSVRSSVAKDCKNLKHVVGGRLCTLYTYIYIHIYIYIYIYR